MAGIMNTALYGGVAGYVKGRGKFNLAMMGTGLAMTAVGGAVSARSDSEQGRAVGNYMMGAGMGMAGYGALTGTYAARYANVMGRRRFGRTADNIGVGMSRGYGRMRGNFGPGF